MKKIVVLLIFFVLCISTLFGQGKAHLRLLGAAIGDSVVLRWAVADYDRWMMANVAGYILERTTLDPKNQVVGKSFERLGPDPIRPWQYSVLEQKINRKDTFALLAAQCLYGKTMRTSQPNGNFIDALQQADEEALNRHSYAAMAADFSAHAADILGWRWVDKTAKKGNKYIYTLRCQLVKGQVVSDTAIFVIKPEDYAPLAPMDPPTLISGEKRVMVSWKRPPHLSAFFIERSADGQNFTRLNQTPFMDWTRSGVNKRDSLIWIDSVGVNYQPFYYRISGINPFAQVSPPSKATKGFAADRTPPLSPLITKGTNEKPGQVKIKWELPPVTETLQGIIVAKTTDPTMQYSQLHSGLLPPITIEFTDDKAWQFGTNYYTVGLVDTAGNIAWSPLFYAVMTDFAPPAKPLGLQGRIDTAGNVQLKWSLGLDLDLLGYQVFVANQADHDFVPLADALITDTVFNYKINLQNLTENIFYKVQAFDKNLKGSELSPMLSLKKPDLVPPDAPVLDDYKVDERTVYLHWQGAHAKDVATQLLLRRSKGQAWASIATLSATARTFTLLSAGQYREYAIQAVDADGLKSEPSFPVAVKIPSALKKKRITTFTATWNEEKKYIQLQWQLAQSCDHLLIYRAYNDEGLELYARVTGNETVFFDRSPKKGAYKYALKPLFADGTEGLLSEMATIIY